MQSFSVPFPVRSHRLFHYALARHQSIFEPLERRPDAARLQQHTVKRVQPVHEKRIVSKCLSRARVDLEDRPKALFSDVAERLSRAGRTAVVVGGWFAVSVIDISKLVQYY